jgi:gas vesicle protein
MSVPVDPSSGIFHFITEHWGTLLTLGGTACGSIAFVWYTLKRTIPDLIDKIKGVKEGIDDVIKEVKAEIGILKKDQQNLDRRAKDLGYAKRGEFFDDKGQPLFQMRHGCLQMRDDCVVERTELKRDICKKMEEVKQQVSSNVGELHEALNNQSEEAADARDQIKDVLSRVERIVEKDRQAERREEMLEMVQALGDKLADSIIGKLKGSPQIISNGK